MKQSKATKAMERAGKELKKPRPLSDNPAEAMLEGKLFDIVDKAKKEGIHD